MNNVYPMASIFFGGVLRKSAPGGDVAGCAIDRSNPDGACDHCETRFAIRSG
jgi:hypothetical protein